MFRNTLSQTCGLSIIQRLERGDGDVQQELGSTKNPSIRRPYYKRDYAPSRLPRQDLESAVILLITPYCGIYYTCERGGKYALEPNMTKLVSLYTIN